MHLVVVDAIVTVVQLVVVGAGVIGMEYASMGEYDGHHLDWEEAERVIPILRQYLLEALEGHQDSPVHALSSTDEVRRPVVERHRHPRSGDALVTGLKEAGRSQAAQIARVMPKGRNFH